METLLLKSVVCCLSDKLEWCSVKSLFQCDNNRIAKWAMRELNSQSTDLGSGALPLRQSPSIWVN